MKRYILTGTPGSGKTSIIRELEIRGAHVVGESATDVIAYKQARGINEPWKNPDFIDDIVKLQKHRQIDPSNNNFNLYFFDRSPICTYALSIYLGFKTSKNLMQEIERTSDQKIYESKVFFIDNLGFIENNSARKISFEESLKFEILHIDTYEKFGYELVRIPSLDIRKRVELIYVNL